MEKPIVLMYHDVYLSDPSESGFCSPGANYYKLSSKQFEEHVNRVSALRQSGKIKNEVIFTFDDGGISFISVVAPILEKYGYVGHFFIATDKIGQKGFLNKDQIKRLYCRHHILGAHSASHPEDMRHLEQSNRTYEWEESIRTINHILGAKTDSVSVPNGYYNKEDIHILASNNIRIAYTSTIGQNDVIDGVILIGRVAITSAVTADYIEKMLTKTRYIKMMQLRQKCLTLTKAVLGNTYMPIKRFFRYIQVKL